MPQRAVSTPARASAIALAVAIAFAAISGAAVAMDAWNRHAPPIFASRPHPPLPQALVRFHELRFDDLWGSLPIDSPVFAATDVAMRTWDADYSSMMRGQILWFALLAASTAWIGAMLAGPGGAAWSAIVAATLPLAYVGALAFDDHLFNMAITSLAVALLVASRGLRRWPLALFAGAVCGVVFRYAFVPSNGLLALGTALCASSGFALHTLAEHQWRPVHAWRRVRLRWATPEAIATRRGAAAWLVALGASAFAFTRYNFVDLHYYTSEIEHGPAATIADWFTQIPAYGAILAVHLVGPAASLAVMLGFWRLFRDRHESRWVMAAWFALPLVALSLVVKKNAYYIYDAAVAAIPVAGYGLARLETGRTSWGPRAAAVLLLIAGIGRALLADAPRPDEGIYGGVFQEASAHVLQGPGTFDARETHLPAPGLVRQMRRAHPEITHPVLLTIGSANLMERLRYGILAEDPRVAVRNPMLTPEPVELASIAAIMTPCELGDLATALANLPRASEIEALDETRATNYRAIAVAVRDRAGEFAFFTRSGDSCFHVRRRF